MMGFSIPDIWDEEEGELQVWGQLELHSKALSQKYKKVKSSYQHIDYCWVLGL